MIKVYINTFMHTRKVLKLLVKNFNIFLNLLLFANRTFLS